MRLIAVGETLRWLASSTLLAGNRDAIVEYFGPHHLEVYTSHRIDVILHSVRDFVREHGELANYGVLRLDLVNVFNLISRNGRLVHINYPNILLWVDYCYGEV